MKNVAIIGGSGYTGYELLRLLAAHPAVEVTAITSRAESGRAVSDIYPSLRGHYSLKFSDPNEISFQEYDLIFFATPHGVAQSCMTDALKSGVKVVDLSADFRIRDIEIWEQWYGQKHACPELVSEAVYGLPEFNRDKIKDAQLIACPGCYPTSIQLALLPLLQSNLQIDLNSIIANSASGTSGAGRQAKIDTLHSEHSDNFKAYGVDGHRHLPEIEQGLADIAGSPVFITFVPHLLPVNRGILSTVYVDVNEAELSDLHELYSATYLNEPFVDVLPVGQQPSLRTVRGTNTCRIGVSRPQNRQKVVITAAEDNLTKGASGQAIQNMNIMFGFNEREGLSNLALLP